MERPKMTTTTLYLDASVKEELDKEAGLLSKVLLPGVQITTSSLIRMILNHRKEIRFIYDKIEETKSG